MNSREMVLLSQVDAALRARGFAPDGGRRKPLPADRLYRKGSERLLVEAKVLPLYRAREFRALIGDAILRFPESERPKPARLLLALELGRMGRDAEADLKEYAARYLPDLCWLLAAQDGPARLHLPPESDETIPGEGPPGSRVGPGRAAGAMSLFTPKSQWLWKCLLLPGIGSRYWAGPEAPSRSVSELAARSGVSQPAVSSFIGRAEAAGFLKRVAGGFAVLNHRELIEEWAQVAKSGSRQVVGVRPLYGAAAESELLERIRQYCGKPPGRPDLPAIVVGYHLACHLLGMGHSNQRGCRLHVAASRVGETLDALELVPDDSGGAPVALVVDGLADSIHRGCVHVDGVPVADALQCYLDVRPSHARGMEQAGFIYERVLQPHFERRYHAAS